MKLKFFLGLEGITPIKITRRLRLVLKLQHEPTNQQDKSAFAIIKDGHVMGHIPKEIASTKLRVGIIRHFLTKPGSKGEV